MLWSSLWGKRWNIILTINIFLKKHCISAIRIRVMFVNTKCIYSIIKVFVAQCKVLFNAKVLFLSDIVSSTLFGNQPHTPKIHWGWNFCDSRASSSQGAPCWSQVSLLSVEDLTVGQSTAFPFVTDRLCLRSKGCSDCRSSVTVDPSNAMKEKQISVPLCIFQCLIFLRLC